MAGNQFMNSLEIYENERWTLVPLEVKLYDLALPLFSVLEDESVIIFGNEDRDKVDGHLGELRVDTVYIGIK